MALDHGHLEEPLGADAVAALQAGAYVESPLGRELADRLSLLIGQAAAARARLSGVSLLLSRPPAAAGEVQPGVVARLIHQIWRSTSDGVLVLEGDGPVRRLFFLRGSPVAVESSEPGEALAGWFNATGRLDEAAREAVQDAMAGGLSAGAALIAAGVVEAGRGAAGGAARPPPVAAGHQRGGPAAAAGASTWATSSPPSSRPWRCCRWRRCWRGRAPT